MEDALRSLGMAPHPPGGDPGSSPVWQGGSEHGIMDASYYLDDLLRNMHGNAADGGDTAGGARGPSHLQVSGSRRGRLRAALCASSAECDGRSSAAGKSC